VIWRPGTAGPQNLNRAWSIVSGASDSHGHRIAGAERIFTLCMSKPKQQTERCLTAHHIFNLAIYQPASRFWLFQGIEAAFFGGLGAALVAGGLWWLRHRVG
jgi:hypothetical protein